MDFRTHRGHPSCSGRGIDRLAGHLVCALTPSPVVEFAAPVHQEPIAAPPPAVLYPSFSQQLPPADINEAVAVEASAPQDVGSLLSSHGQVVDFPIPRGVEEIQDVP